MKFKQGDTFDFSGAPNILDPAGLPVSLVGWVAVSHIRHIDSGQVFPLTVAWTDASNTVLRLFAADTRGWPLGLYETDIEFTSPAGNVISTETQKFSVLRDVTRV